MSQEAWIGMHKFCQIDKVCMTLNQFLKNKILYKANKTSKPEEVLA